MTKTQIRKFLKELIRDGWVIFKDKTDKAYFLKSIKEDDLETIFEELNVSEFEQGYEFIKDLEEEFNSL